MRTTLSPGYLAHKRCNGIWLAQNAACPDFAQL
jgi:hypothetical protein